MRGTSSRLLMSVARTLRLTTCSLLLFVCVSSQAQQTDISRYSLYTGFDYMLSPSRNLTERGMDVDFGVTLKPWLAVGGDVAFMGNDIFGGGGTINGSETVYAPLVDPYVPASSIHVPFKSTTITFAVGTQFYLRKWTKVTFFARPGLGGIHESAALTFPPELEGLFTEILKVPVPSSQQTSTTWFVGVGGGFDLNLSKQIALRFSADWVNTHLFSNLLTDRQNYARLTVGPVFHWGKF